MAASPRIWVLQLALHNFHLENQCLVCHGIYTDINDDKWVKCNKSLTPYHVVCVQEILTLVQSTFVPSWPVANRSKCKHFVLVALLSVSLLIVSDFIISFIYFSMGCKGTSDPPKWCLHTVSRHNVLDSCIGANILTCGLKMIWR